MPLLEILAFGISLTKAPLISFLYCQKLDLNLNLDYNKKHSMIRRINFIINLNILLLIKHILFGAVRISEKNIGCFDI